MYFPRLVLQSGLWPVPNPQHDTWCHPTETTPCDDEHHWIFRPVKIWHTAGRDLLAVVTEPAHGWPGMTVTNAPDHYLGHLYRTLGETRGLRFRLRLVAHTPDTPPIRYALWHPATGWRPLSETELAQLIGTPDCGHIIQPAAY